jgi:hypothetical protein
MSTFQKNRIIWLPGNYKISNGSQGLSSQFCLCQRTLQRMIIGCCYLTVDSATTALKNGACTSGCISKQMHYKTPLSHNGYTKSLGIYENYISLSCLEKNKNLYDIIFTQNHTWHIPQVVEITFYYKQLLRNNTIL